jgi:hypothetical protein
MEQIADALAAHGLPAGFHHAATEIYRRVGHPTSHTVNTIVELLNGSRPRQPG